MIFSMCVCVKKLNLREFLGGPVVRSPLQGSQVQTLVGELRSHKLQHTLPARTKQKQQNSITQNAIKI